MDIAYTCNHASFNLNAARSRLELAWINRGERSRALLSIVSFDLSSEFLIILSIETSKVVASRRRR